MKYVPAPVLRLLPLSLVSFVWIGALAAPATACAQDPVTPAAGPAAAPQEKQTSKAQEPAKPKPKAKPTVKLVALGGTYADLAEQSMDLQSLLLGGGDAPRSLYATIEKLDALAAAASDGESKAKVLLDLSKPVGMNLAQIAEVSRCLGRVRAAGHEVWAYLENANRQQYLLACMADHVLMADMGMMDFGSLSLSVTFLKDALDLLGVQFDVVRCGDFKGAVEPYVLSAMSKHLRQHYLDMLESMNQGLVQHVAAARKLEPDAVRALQGKRLLTAKEALQARLVDRLVPWSGAQRALTAVLAAEPAPEYEDVLAKKKERKSFNLMTMMSSFLQPKAEKKLDEDAIVVLHLSGAIADGHQRVAGSIVSGPTVKLIEELAANEKVKGVVVRINSPGGSATASEAIVLALEKLAAAKPVACSMGSVAASGGYYVTCFGRPVFAERGTITGSIGVFGMKPQLGALMRRIGVREELVALDDSAGMDSLDRGWTEDERQRLQQFVDDVYERFVGHVASSRHLERDAVLKIAGGRVWSGRQALERGLVDHLGGLQDAIDLVAKEAKLAAPKVRHLPEPRSFVETMLEGMGDLEALVPAGVRELLAQRPGLRALTEWLAQGLRAPQPFMVQARMPAHLELR